jgi:phosphatidylserine decarboxylase
LASAAILLAALTALAVAGGYFYWRRVWFFRNPPRRVPSGDNLVSAADGTVVYVKTLRPGEDVINIKRGLAARLGDIAHVDDALPRLLIGVFMSPFDVHYNRAPCAGTVRFVRHYPGQGSNLHMGVMHWRVLTRRRPYYRGSVHIVRNERTVTRIDGAIAGKPLSCYVVQIAARTVAGIESYIEEGASVGKGSIFGMIRVGSQVDIVVPLRDGMRALVQPGDRVRAGETVMVA